MKQEERKHKVGRLLSMALALCMAVGVMFGFATEAQAKSNSKKYSKSITLTFKLPADTQYGIWVELDKPGKVKAQVTSQAKKKTDRMALVALGSGNGEKTITPKKKTVTLQARTVSNSDPNWKRICLYLTNGSDKAVKYKVKFTALNKGGKVLYLYKENNGGGAG